MFLLGSWVQPQPCALVCLLRLNAPFWQALLLYNSSYATPRFNVIQLLSIADPSRRCTNSSASTIIGTSASHHFPLNDSLAWRWQILMHNPTQNIDTSTNPCKPLQTPEGMPRPRLQPRPFQELINVHPSGWHTTTLSNPPLFDMPVGPFIIVLCILNSPSHQLLVREPRRSFRPQRPFGTLIQAWETGWKDA